MPDEHTFSCIVPIDLPIPGYFILHQYYDVPTVWDFYLDENPGDFWFMVQW